MKKYLWLVVALISFFSSCNDMNLVKQEITCAGDCSYCAPVWSWSNGVATIEDDMYFSSNGDEIYPQFNISVKVNGELSFRYKINDDYLGYICVRGAGVNFSDDEEGPTEWTLIKAGHVQKGKKISFDGRECSVKDIIIVGQMEDNKPATEDPAWDF